MTKEDIPREEPEVVVWGRLLSEVHVLLIRIALTELAVRLSEPDALGEEEIDHALQETYRDRAGEVLRLMRRAA